MLRRLSLLALLCPLLLIAHDLYLLPERFYVKPGDKVLLSIHNGDSFPDSEDPVDPARLIHPRLVTATGTLPLSGFQILDKSTHTLAEMPGPGSVWFAVQTAPKYIEMLPDKFEAYLKEEGLDEVVAARHQSGRQLQPGRERYAKFAKSYLVSGQPDLTFQKPLGLTIEIVPLADPASIRPGGQLPIQVLFENKPLANMQIERATGGNELKILGRTDAQGRLSVPIVRAGRHRLHALLMKPAPASDPQADWMSFWASLTFEVKP